VRARLGGASHPVRRRDATQGVTVTSHGAYVARDLHDPVGERDLTPADGLALIRDAAWSRIPPPLSGAAARRAVKARRAVRRRVRS